MRDESWIEQCLAASGYLCVFIAPALLILGFETDKPLLAFGTVMAVYPLARPVFGELDERMTAWREPISTLLHRLPLAYAACLPIALFWLPVQYRDSAPAAVGLLVCAGLSLWITLLLSTCVAHELIHRRSDADARVGRWVAAMAGYPLLGFEHLAHHLRTGDRARAQWASVEESVWAFAARRQLAVLQAAISLALGRSGSDRTRRALFEACGVTMFSATAFGAAMGWRGAVLYGATAIGVAFGFHAINYLQHWGLGPQEARRGPRHVFAWEDSCRFQAWVTLSVSCHQAHHRDARRPFYLLTLERGSPRQPAGYLILLFLSLVPSLWRRLMLPVLDAWRRDPAPARPVRRHLTCFRTFGADPP